jgi:hypothetical protein
LFGLQEDRHPWPFPLHRVIEPLEGLGIFELGRGGALTEGAYTTVKVGSIPCQLASHGVEIFVNGFPIQTRPHPMCAARVWVCPACGRDAYRVYLIAGAWICRRCGRLEHSSRRIHRTVFGRARALWIRRRLGLEARLFVPLPEIPQSHKRRYALLRELKLLESQLVKHLAGINDAMERRLERGK